MLEKQIITASNRELLKRTAWTSYEKAFFLYRALQKDDNGEVIDEIEGADISSELFVRDVHRLADSYRGGRMQELVARVEGLFQAMQNHCSAYVCVDRSPGSGLEIAVGGGDDLHRPANCPFHDIYANTLLTLTFFPTRSGVSIASDLLYSDKLRPSVIVSQIAEQLNPKELERVTGDMLAIVDRHVRQSLEIR